MMKSCGKQLNKDELYKRQGEFIEKNSVRPGPVIIADNIHSPENVAAIIRAADAAGSKKIYFSNSNIDAISKKITRIARNADNSIQIEFVTLDDLKKLGAKLLPMLAVEITSKSRDIFETKLPSVCSLIIGSERHGISDELLAMCDSAVHIPMYGQNSSMNVAQALSVVLFEWRRQQDYN